MNHCTQNKTRPALLLAALALSGMMAILSQPAFAITAFNPQTQPTGYVGQDVVTNGTLTSGNETLFRTEYGQQYWNGNVYAYPISATGVIDTVGEKWGGGAAPQIQLQNFSTGRYIGTMRDDGTKVPFLSGSLSAAQQGTLAATISGTSYNSTQIVSFLRGDHSLEGTTALRQRLAPQGSGSTPIDLGDIVHSKPYYLADATSPTIFVGANDGMLHAIDVNTGYERWAYVPSMLIPKMKALANNPYTHDYYVDGQIAVGNATVSGTRILVGGLGAGGKGLYALNIDSGTGLTATSDQDAANKILWEITPTTLNYATPQMKDGTVNASAYSNLGYTYGSPEIRTINNSGTAERVVIVGNGYNNGGDYQAYLFVINAADGKLVRAIKADSSATNTTGRASVDGTSASPNGLMNTLAFDSNSDGYIDRVYGGDLNGTMWKFDLSSPTPSSWSASVLYVTSPAQPITTTPAALPHPSGNGYMVDFATGSAFTGTQPTTGTGATGDLGDTSSFYVYGIWDGAPASNVSLLQPTLTERCYNLNGVPSDPPCPGTQVRVRRVSASTPNWAPGGNLGWKVALPIGGERVLGEGAFISSGRYYFSTYNPTISYLVPGTTTYVWGENWQMALDAVTGSSVDPFMDLNGDGIINNDDRIRYTATDAPVVATPPTQTAGSPIFDPNVDGIEVGKWVSRGVESQPTLVKLTNLFTTLFNTNPDVAFPPPPAIGTGVNNGHFDTDNFYGPVSPSASATATITVGSTGDPVPATLGGIQIDGVTVVPALTVSDITDGTATSTNATTIKNKFSSGIYTASVSGSTITVTAPPGTSYNGKTITILPGTSSGTPGTAGIYPTGLISFGGGSTSYSSSGRINDDLSNSRSVYVGGTSAYSNTITIGKGKNAAQAAAAVVSAIGTGGTIQAYVGGDNVTPTCAAKPNTVVCLIDTSTYSNGRTVTIGSTSYFNTLTVNTTATAGGSAGTPGTGWRNLAPALSTTSFSGGADGSTSGNSCTGASGSTCRYIRHVHQYDKVYDVTGVNLLNPNQTDYNLAVAIPSTTQRFKVIMHNQYLNPAVKLHIGDPSYLPNVDFGYVRVKDYTTSATLDLATLPTYVDDPSATGNGFAAPKYIGSLALNMPVDALSAKDWWGNGDVRSGLIPTIPQCVWSSVGSHDGNMFQPVIAPANDPTLGYPLDGPGTLGYSSSTTPASASGVRHGGALVLQVIRDTTPNSDIELNDSRGRPEYGWRVKSAKYSTDVLMEFIIYWHHPSGLCFNDAGWTKAAGPDTHSSATAIHTPGATDPKIGSLNGGTGGTVTSVVTVGDTTTITYADGSKDIIQKISHPDGTVTTVTTHLPAGVNVTVSNVVNADGSVTTTLTASDGSTVTATAAAGASVTLASGVTISNVTTANTAGSTGTGGLLNQNAIGYRRISWKELIRN